MDFDAWYKMMEESMGVEQCSYKKYADARRVTPLVEIQSVSIHRFGGVQTCKLYGHIRVLDEFGDTFDLFNRGSDDPEHVDIGGTLLLSSNASVVPSDRVCVDVCLFDKAHNDDVLLAKGEFLLRRTVVDCKGELVSKRVVGDGDSFVEVHYSIFPFAVVATVDVLYFSKDDDFDLLSNQSKQLPIVGCFGDVVDYIDYDKRERANTTTFANVYGTITARNGIVFSGSSNYNASVLFRKSPEQSVSVTSGDFIKLSRSIVAVPANSSLKIQVDLYDRDSQLPVGCNTLEFDPQERYTFKKDLVGDNGRIRVRVKWSDGYRQLHRVKMLQNPKLLSELQSPSFVRSIGGMPSSYLFGYDGEPIPMVEVFSVVVCGKDFKPFSFYGNIRNHMMRLRFFSRDRNCPQYCPAEGTQIKLESHVTLDVVDDFSLYSTIKDVVDKSVISRGNLIWRNIYRDAKWFDRPLCSLIPGDSGFAAVHYAIFYDAISVMLDVKLCGRGVSASTKVYGELVARYGTVDYDYSTLYEKKYYQSVLFQEDEETSLESPDYTLPLLKSVVAVPRNSLLVLDVKLWVNPGVDGVRKERLRQKLEFPFCDDLKSYDDIIGRNVSMKVCAKYDKIYYNQEFFP